MDKESPVILKRADISTREPQTIDLEGRYSQIAEAIAAQTGFTPEGDVEKSTWWGKKVGAVRYKGTFPTQGRNTSAVLKIEAVKMQPDEITEAAMIHHAEQALAGSGIRPPKVYREIPWTDEQQGYSAMIMEDVPTNSPLLPVPGTEEDIAAMLAIRQQYRDALQRNNVTPWIENEAADVAQFVTTKFAKWKQASNDTFPSHPFRESTDEALIDRAIAVLEEGYKDVALEFQQGHFSHRDIVKVDDELVMFSNLYWAWRAPFYDAVFASHWYMYELANADGITIGQIEEQRCMWDRQYKKLTDDLSPGDKRLFALARIERLAAGLNIDALSISEDPQNEIARYVVNQTRKDLTEALTS